jgi:hypothetical protein
VPSRATSCSGSATVIVRDGGAPGRSVRYDPATHALRCPTQFGAILHPVGRKVILTPSGMNGRDVRRAVEELLELFIGAGFDHRGAVCTPPGCHGVALQPDPRRAAGTVHDRTRPGDLPARHELARRTGWRVQVSARSFPYRRPATTPRRLARLTPRPPNRRTSHSRARHPEHNARTEFNVTRRATGRLAVPRGARY